MPKPVSSGVVRVVLATTSPDLVSRLRSIASAGNALLNIVAIADSPVDVVRLGLTNADVILLDLDCDAGAAIDVVPALLRHDAARILGFTNSRDAAFIERAILAAGMHGLSRKDEAPDSILEAIESVHRGELWLDGQSMGSAFMALVQTHMHAGVHTYSRV